MNPSVFVVSGLPRSGTSMAMRMLHLGGLAVMADDLRQADESNPNGYFELDRIRRLANDPDTSWLAEAQGKAIKIVSSLLAYLPPRYQYRVIFMQRSLPEVVASQNRMIARAGRTASTATDAELLRFYEQHLRQVERWLTQRACFTTLRVDYRDALANPVAEAHRINAFVGGVLNTEDMCRAVDPSLYRNRLAQRGS